MNMLRRLWCRIFHRKYHAWYIGSRVYGGNTEFTLCHWCGEEGVRLRERAE